MTEKPLKIKVQTIDWEKTPACKTDELYLE
jgi:hypothetical protein